MRVDTFDASNPRRRAIGWAVVAVVHALVLWALVSGTARQGLDLLKKPLEAVVIQEVIIPPPPPPPPPPKPVRPPEPQAPKVQAPPPFVPPPVVAPPVAAAPPVIAATPVPPPAPSAAATPPSPAPRPARSEMGLVCPTQVKPEMPPQAIRQGLEGVVRAEAVIRDGAVREVTIVSGPRVFHASVRNAMLQYRCVREPGETRAVQEFAFKIE